MQVKIGFSPNTFNSSTTVSVIGGLTADLASVAADAAAFFNGTASTTSSCAVTVNVGEWTRD
jgi:hypothetical protein